MKYRRAVVVMTVAAMGCGALAQSRKSQERAQPEVLKSYAADRSERVERELAELIQKRISTAPQDQAYLELRIDLRIVQRWLLKQLLAGDPYGDQQAVTWLRHRDLADLISTVDGWAQQQAGTGTTRLQTESMIAIHKATYGLEPVKDVAALDAVLTPLREPLLRALGDTEGQAPDMRPVLKRAPKASDTDEPQPQPEAPASLEELSGRVMQLAISVPLRQQLLATIGTAKMVDEPERGRLLDMLRSTVDLAQAINANVGIDPASRPGIEASLIEAIALFTDPRLRDAGEQRLAGLKQYRELAGRVTSIALPPEVMRQLAPAFAYARENPDAGAKVLGAIEALAGLEAEARQHQTAPTTDVIGRQINAAFKSYLDERAGFIEEAGRLKAGGMFVSSPDDLPRRVASMRGAMEAIRVLKRLPQAQSILLELKPRPTGALEKRITQTVVRLQDSDAATRDAAWAFLSGVDDLATTWDALREQLAGADEPATMKYAGMDWAALGVRARALASDAATEAAGTGAVERGDVDALKRLGPLIEQIRMLGGLESRLAQADTLSRWADCTLTEVRISRLLDTYRADFAAIIDSALKGEIEGKQTQQLRQRYRGLLEQLEVLAGAVEPTAQLPAGPRGQIARLTTPSHHAPFATTRYLSLMTDLIEMARMSEGVDLEEVDRLEEQMLQRLNRK